MSEAGIAGLGAAIVIDKKIVRMKGYGFDDRARAVQEGKHFATHTSVVTDRWAIYEGTYIGAGLAGCFVELAVGDAASARPLQVSRGFLSLC